MASLDITGKVNSLAEFFLFALDIPRLKEECERLTERNQRLQAENTELRIKLAELRRARLKHWWNL